MRKEKKIFGLTQEKRDDIVEYLKIAGVFLGGAATGVAAYLTLFNANTIPGLLPHGHDPEEFQPDGYFEHNGKRLLKVGKRSRRNLGKNHDNSVTYLPEQYIFQDEDGGIVEISPEHPNLNRLEP